MHIHPVDVKARKKQRKVETEVADLRKRMEETTGKNIVLSNREIRLLRYLALTEDEKEKLKGNYKVAKKLEKLESMGQDKGDSSDEDEEDERNEDTEYPSLESCTSDNSQSGQSIYGALIFPNVSVETFSYDGGVETIFTSFSSSKCTNCIKKSLHRHFSDPRRQNFSKESKKLHQFVLAKYQADDLNFLQRW